uniref:RTP1_C1 domain-containing protein n=1 Tax=Caenorhabditis tropicalis TaxID=1561998 RepID=A0A1I7TNN8_9PELO
MLKKDELIQVISQLITPPAEAWKNDPFEILVKQCPKDLFDKYVDSPIEDSIPSTSEDVRTINTDARIHFSQLLGGLYLELANLLEAARATSEDEYQLVSLKDVDILKSSFEFFLLAGILPFLEPGVGLPASSRSTFIKSWKLYDGNKEACIERLAFAAKVMVALLKSNNVVTVQFLPKFIFDVLAIRYQLLELKIERYETDIEEIVSKCPTDLLFGALMFLTQDRKVDPTPKWLKMACGKQMTLILVGKNGLSHLLQYYHERAGDNWTDNLPMTRQVAWHLATVPKMFKVPLKYHEIVSNQFLESFYTQKVLDKNMLNIFINYADQLRVRFSLNADLTIYDKILHFWEALDKKIQDKTSTDTVKVDAFSPNYIKNLQLLAQLQSSLSVKRIRALFNCLLACAEHIPHVRDILKAALDNVGSLGFTIYQYVMTPSLTISLEKKTTSKIQEIGENQNETDAPAQELWLHGFANADEGVARRLETAFYVVDNVLSSAQVRTIFEMMNAALEDFLKVSEKEREDDSARFVHLEGSKLFSSLHAHLLIGCCFERLTVMCDDAGFSQEECMQLLRLCESIVNNATAKYMRIIARKRQVDVFRFTPSEKKEFECTRDTVRMCLPIVSAVFFLTQGTPRLQDIQMKSIEAIANFIKAADHLPSDDYSFNAAIEESKRLLRELKIDVSQVSPPVIQQRPELRRRYTQLDICNEWIEELHEDEPAIKGGALMQISRVFRNKTWHSQKLMEYGIFETVKDLVSDDDSYVYLSAINCLCEMGIYSNENLELLIEHYEDMTKIPQKDEAMVIRIGRLAEAIGKLMMAKGEHSILFFDRLASIFMSGINESDEILRASSCGAFGNLLRATRSRGIEKWMDQLFHALTNVLRADRSPLVRRSAADLIRHCLSTTGTDLFLVHRERLLDIHREVRALTRTDRDETVRLHAQLCLDEINAALNQNHEETDRGYHRRIRF